MKCPEWCQAQQIFSVVVLLFFSPSSVHSFYMFFDYFAGTEDADT